MARVITITMAEPVTRTIIDTITYFVNIAMTLAGLMIAMGMVMGMVLVMLGMRTMLMSVRMLMMTVIVTVLMFMTCWLPTG